MDLLAIIKLCILTFALGFCCYTDVKYRKIKNYITFPLMLIGMILNSIQQQSLHGIWYSISAILVMFLLCILMSLSGGFGFGDTKLLMGVASMCGLWMSIDVLVFALFTMIIYFLIFKTKLVKDLFINLKYMVNTVFILHKMPTLNKDESTWTVPYACFISLGFVVAFLYNNYIGGNLIWNILNIN